MTSTNPNERNDGTSGTSQRPENEAIGGRAGDGRTGDRGPTSSASRSRSRRNLHFYPLQDESAVRRIHSRTGEIQLRLAAHSFRGRRRPMSSKLRQVSQHSLTTNFSAIQGHHSLPRLELATLDALEVASELTSGVIR